MCGVAKAARERLSDAEYFFAFPSVIIVHQCVNWERVSPSDRQKCERSAALFAAATGKKTEKGDGSSRSTSGGGGGGGNRSPHDRKDPPSPQPPPEELQQQQQQDQQQQQQQQQEASEMQGSPPQRQPTPSPQPHHRQPQPPPQQPLPRQPPPKPKHPDDLSSSDHNSDLDSLYGSLRRSQGKSVHISESDGETTPQGSIGQGRRLAPRRHTVGGAQIREQLRLGDVSVVVVFFTVFSVCVCMCVCVCVCSLAHARTMALPDILYPCYMSMVPVLQSVHLCSDYFIRLPVHLSVCPWSVCLLLIKLYGSLLLMSLCVSALP